MSRVVTIGRATLHCGDAYEIRPNLGRFDCDVMDPPYDFDNSGGGAFRKARGASNQIVEEELDQGFDHTIINPLLCGAAIVFCHNNQLHKLLPHLAGLFHRHVVNMWIKPNPSPMRNKNYLADTEPFIHAWLEGFEPTGAHHDMHRWHKEQPMPSKKFGHPTVKPQSLMDKIITNAAGQSICDPFMGTGSTGVAAIIAGKSFVGIEKNPKHFETAVRRISEAQENWERAQ